MLSSYSSYHHCFAIPFSWALSILPSGHWSPIPPYQLVLVLVLVLVFIGSSSFRFLDELWCYWSSIMATGRDGTDISDWLLWLVSVVWDGGLLLSSLLYYAKLICCLCLTIIILHERNETWSSLHTAQLYLSSSRKWESWVMDCATGYLHRNKTWPILYRDAAIHSKIAGSRHERGRSHGKSIFQLSSIHH